MVNDRKHAYLIVAHNNFSILKVLLKLLDDTRNDLFIHIDKKIKVFDFNDYKNQCTFSSVYFIGDRIDVRWGRSSQVDAEMSLFHEAHSHGHYAYYHLISGVDLPIKTQNEIHSYFQGKTENFIYYSNKTSLGEYERISLFYHIPLGGKIARICEEYFRQFQRLIKIDRFSKLKKKGYTFERGANWVSLTNEAVEALLFEKKTIQKMTRYSHCADELYKQIILKKAGVPIYFDKNGNTTSLRYVDWSRGDGNHPYIFQMCDFDLIKTSDKLFARKFDQDIDFDIVEAIFRWLSKKDELIGDY